MTSIPGLGGCYNVGCGEGEFRLCRCPVFIKLCKREVCQTHLTPIGVYYPVCAWRLLVQRHTGLSVADRPHLNNQQFQELVREGLIGSTPGQSSEIEAHLITTSGDGRLKLVFEEERKT